MEWFIDDDAEMSWRMFEYAFDLQAAIRADDAARVKAERQRAREDPDAPAPVVPDRVCVRSCAVPLDGPVGPLPAAGQWAWSLPDSAPHEACVMHYRVDAVYQRTTEARVAQPGVLWPVFAPLATDVSEENLRLAVQAARERANSRAELEDIASAMRVIAAARPKDYTLTQRILDMFKEEGILERTWLFQRGV